MQRAERTRKSRKQKSVKIFWRSGIKYACSRPYIIRRGDVIMTVVEKVAMIRANPHRFGAIRALVSVGLLAIGVVASTAVPAIAAAERIFV
jgi:hypothetical protein